MSENIVKNMSKDAVFTRVEAFGETKIKCNVNMYTREVFGFTEWDEEWDENVLHDEFLYEYVTVDGIDYYVVCLNTEDDYYWYEVHPKLKSNLFWRDKYREDIEVEYTASQWDEFNEFHIVAEINSRTHEILSYDIENIRDEIDDTLSDEDEGLEHMDYECIQTDGDLEFLVVPKSELKYYDNSELAYMYWYDDDKNIHYTDYYKKKNGNITGVHKDCKIGWTLRW